MGSFIVFIILAVIALSAAVGMVLSQNAVHSALFLILNMATLAVFYILLNAPFIAMVQVTVYAGAIMVLFLFVIMLLGAEQLRGVGGGAWQNYLALLLGVALIATFGAALLTEGATTAGVADPIDAGPVAVGMHLFESYVLPFEITSVLLLVAMIGVIVLRGRQSEESNNA
ncbi:MAG TPA: NADH-quinone oxidoreductase subunit J [Candidatus Sulfomarinibacteraceae bacterium]|nr:NADH-quinone oxidoreductase subunit J [Candidatus Sulfomarinibacteraceae bacterium]